MWCPPLVRSNSNPNARTSVTISPNRTFCGERIAFWSRFRLFIGQLSRAFARHNLVLLAFADAPQRVILPKRIAAVSVPRQDPAQVRVADEDDAVHVVDLALH